jgi:predicted small secreted protein
MKKFLLGVGVGIALTCAWFSATAVVKQHRLASKVEQAAKAAEQAARAAAEAAPTQAPAR